MLVVADLGVRVRPGIQDPGVRAEGGGWGVSSCLVSGAEVDPSIYSGNGVRV